MYVCESWTIRMTEHQRIDAFKLWCWRRLMRVPWVPWTSRRSNHSILNKINLKYALGGLVLKLNEAPILWPPDARTWLTGKDPVPGKDWRQEEKGVTEDEMVEWYHWLNGHEPGQTLRDGEGQGGLAGCSPWGSQRVRHDLATEQQAILSGDECHC